MFHIFFCASREEFDQEEKAKFGELCSGENAKGREWFARFVSAQVRRGLRKRTCLSGLGSLGAPIFL